MGEEGGGGDGRSKEGFFEKVKDEDDFKGSRLDFQFLTFLLACFFFWILNRVCFSEIRNSLSTL